MKLIDKMTKFFIMPALILAVLVGKAAAFWQYGHLFGKSITYLIHFSLVARVAQDQLSFTKNGQSALDKANSLLRVYSSSNPSMTNLEGAYPFVECATFADEIKSRGGTWQSGWHFVDTPYLDEGGSIEDFPGFKFDVNSIDKAIADIIEWLSDASTDYKNSFVYTTMQTNLPTLSEEELRSYALRLLIHYVGDIHQPLHATARVNSKYPKGDAGGNFVTIPTKDGAKNLHSVWDSVNYLYTANPVMVSKESPHLFNFYSHSLRATGVISVLRPLTWRAYSASLLVTGKTMTLMPGPLSPMSSPRPMCTLT